MPRAKLLQKIESISRHKQIVKYNDHCYRLLKSQFYVNVTVEMNRERYKVTKGNLR